MATPLYSRVHYGGDYNPEQWPRDIWREDVELMNAAGVDLVTVGVFSWAKLEPGEGVYCFDWLRDVLDLLQGVGVGVVLATPTAAPPAWMSVRYPEILPVDATGARYSHGSRQTICLCSPVYREKSAQIAARLAAEVGQHEAVAMWHIHNEYSCEVAYCYCENHARRFRAWLQQRYGSLDALNDAWGSVFWSQTYTDFDQVVPPRMTGGSTNPGLALDYKRFISDTVVDALVEQREVLRQARPDLPATTNFMGLFKPLDYRSLAAHLDVVSTDNYPDPADPEWPMRSAMHYDLVRSLNKAAPWIVMEQAVSRVVWRSHNAAKKPGEMRAMCYQSIARGAAGTLFFQWRASRKGAEAFHSAMVPHAGIASPSWAEVASLGKELARLEGFAGARVQAGVAIIFSWQNWWAVEEPPKPANDLSLADNVSWAYRPLYRSGVTVDFCDPAEALGTYRAVILPNVYMLSEVDGSSIASYVRSGGTAIISFWSGIVDEMGSVYLGPYGGPLRRVMGCDVVDVAPLAPDEPVEMQWEDGERSTGTFWADVIEEGDGRALARFSGGPFAGRPAVVETTYGSGRAYYVGTRLDEAGMERLYGHVPALAARPAAATAGTGVERVVRMGKEKSYEFLINHSDQVHTIELAQGGVDLLSGDELVTAATLAPAGVAIISRPLPA